MTLPKRIEEKINKEGPGGCWLWTGTIIKCGYGQVGFKGKVHYAHRVVYQHLVGDIPEDKELDHVCRTKSCVNPGHIEVVTHEVNCRRGHQETHCPYGHPYDETNTYIDSHGWRFCRECHRRRRNRDLYERRNKR